MQYVSEYRNEDDMDNVVCKQIFVCVPIRASLVK